MPEKLFTKESRHLPVGPLTPPPDAVVVRIRFDMRPTPDFKQPENEGVLILNAGLATDQRPPLRQTFELVLRNQLRCELDGFGPAEVTDPVTKEKRFKHPEHQKALELGPRPTRYEVLHNLLTGAIVVSGDGTVRGKGTTHIKPGARPLMLTFGFEGPGKLFAPEGMILSWGDDAITWLDANGAEIREHAPPPPPPPPGIVVSPPSLRFVSREGGPKPPPQTVKIESTGGVLGWSASATRGNVVSLSQTSGDTPATLTVEQVAGLPAGQHSTSISIASGGAPVSVPILVDIEAAGPAPDPDPKPRKGRNEEIATVLEAAAKVLRSDEEDVIPVVLGVVAERLKLKPRTRAAILLAITLFSEE